MPPELSEAGRVLSKANETKLRTAFKEMQEVLSLLDGDDDSEEASEARRDRFAALAVSLQEAANLGNWLEARIHLAFTEIADYMFGDGRVTREERIGLSAAIGAALDAFNTSVSENLPQVYERSPWADPEVQAEMTEAALETDFIPLTERALRRDGTVALKLIEPGWGASGYYPAAVLERDGPVVFKAGTKSFWNHATPTEEAERPEGDLNALAMELISDARWQESGPAGPGLYADAKVFKPYQEAVNELAPHIGVSIRATGRASQGEAEGRKGPVISQITNARSVDIVTEAGAGGKILDMFEAARTARRDEIIPESQQEESVNEQQFNEAVTRLATLETQNKELVEQNARFREALLLRDAREFVRTELARETVPDITRNRLVESLSANPPVTEAGDLDKAAFTTRISEAVKAEVAYLTQAAGYGSGRIEGMGSGGGNAMGEQATQPSEEDMQKRMTESFRAMGLSEKEAAIAATGRGW